MGTFDFGDALDDVEDDAGPWFFAAFDSKDASCCGMDIEEGDEIRAAGDGGWEHRECVEGRKL